MNKRIVRFTMKLGAAFSVALSPFFVTLPATAYTEATEAESLVYTLGSGDKVRVTIFGEADLSGEFEVDGTGALSLPLVGEVQAGGLSLRALEKTIETVYKGDYLLNPKVSAEVMNFRPFFILGEVNAPGNYPYISGMNVLNAVAVAGGYTTALTKIKSPSNVKMVKNSM